MLEDSIQMFTLLSRNLQKETNIGLQKISLILPHLCMTWLLDKKALDVVQVEIAGRQTISVTSSCMGPI